MILIDLNGEIDVPGGWTMCCRLHVLCHISVCIEASSVSATRCSKSSPSLANIS